jgi:MFS family permease
VRFLDVRRDTGRFLVYSAVYHVGLFGIADVILNFYFVSLGYDPQTIALLQSMPRVAGFVASVPLSLWANRIGSRRMIALSNYGVVVAMLLPVIVPLLPVVAISRLLLGFFYGAQQIGQAPLMVTLVEKHERTRFFALHNVTSLTAAAAGNFLGGRLPSIVAAAPAGTAPAAAVASAQTPFAYGVTLLIAAVVVLASVVPFAFVRRDASAAPAPPIMSMRESRATWTHLAFLTLPMLLFGFTGGLTFPFYNLLFRTQFRLPDEAVGTVIGIGWMGMALIPMLNPLWERLFGRVHALAITMALAAVGFALLSIAPSLGLAVVGFAIGISFRNVMNPLYQPLLLDRLPPSLHNNVGGMSGVMWSVGWFTSTAIGGVLQTTVGFGGMMALVTVGMLLTSSTILAIFRKPRAVPAALTE